MKWETARGLCHGMDSLIEVCVRACPSTNPGKVNVGEDLWLQDSLIAMQRIVQRIQSLRKSPHRLMRTRLFRWARGLVRPRKGLSNRFRNVQGQCARRRERMKKAGQALA